MTTAQQQRALGAYGERIAARHLESIGMTVLDRNWRCRYGEIDLVLRDGEDLVVAEVKSRRGDAYGHPLSAVTVPKLDRIRGLASLWAEQHAVVRTGIRIDLVAVLVPRRGPARVEHVPGVC